MMVLYTRYGVKFWNNFFTEKRSAQFQKSVNSQERFTGVFKQEGQPGLSKDFLIQW